MPARHDACSGPRLHAVTVMYISHKTKQAQAMVTEFESSMKSMLLNVLFMPVTAVME